MPGIKAEYFNDGEGRPALERVEPQINFTWEMRSPDPAKVHTDNFHAHFEGKLAPKVSGFYTFRLSGQDTSTLSIDDNPIVVNTAVGQPQTGTAIFRLEAGRVYDVQLEYHAFQGDASLHLEWSLPRSKEQEAKALEVITPRLRRADAVLFVGGWGNGMDTEGADRASMDFPPGQEKLIRQIAPLNPHTAVVLLHGSPFKVDGWIGSVPAVLDAFYPGMEGGAAIAKALIGDINPSGKLTFTWPKRLEDSPSHAIGNQDRDNVNYKEGVFVGYRYFDTKNIVPQFPFGYGLSYSQFKYTGLQQSMGKTDLQVSAKVTNTSNRRGAEIVQLYVGSPAGPVPRPIHELKGFSRETLEPSQTATIRMTLGPRSFAYWDDSKHAWNVLPGRYTIALGASSRDIRLRSQVIITKARADAINAMLERSATGVPYQVSFQQGSEVMPRGNEGRVPLRPGWLRGGSLAIATFGLCLAVRVSPAEMIVHPFFRDHMVLQRDMPVPVWGWATAGDHVKVMFNGQRKSVVTDPDGRWQVTLDPMGANADSQEMIIAEADGSAKQTLKDVLVGEVWLCAGQSNMLAPTSSLSSGPELIRGSANVRLRLYRVDVRSSSNPEETFERGSLGPMLPAEKEALDKTALRWQVASPAAVATFSGVAYNYGRLLQADLGVPVGILEAAFGGTTAEQWIPQTALANDAQLASLVRDFKGFVTDPNYPGGLYNGSIFPLLPAAVRGVVWYQGESNSQTYPRAIQYRVLLSTLITNWRAAWKRDLPFLVVQIASFHAALPEPSDDPLPRLRGSQALVVQELSNTALIVAIDLGVADDWHPANKAVLGQRLEAAALKLVYGRKMIDGGPELADFQADGDRIALRFKNIGRGLIAQDIITNRGRYHVPSSHLAGFAVAGPDHCFHWATARIAGDHVYLSAPTVQHPVDVRYAWAAFPMANLANEEGFPAAPFRTDQLAPRTDCEQR